MSKVILNRLIPLWDSLAQSAQGDLCATARDREIFEHRASSEGLPYLSDGLAGLGRAFLNALGRGYVEKKDFDQIRFTLKEGSTLPLFLYSAWSKVFTDDGLGIGASFETDDQGVQRLTAWHPPIKASVAVRWLRQLTVVFSKLRLPYSKTRNQAALDRFIANEEELARVKTRLWRGTYSKDLKFPHSAGSKQNLETVLLNASRLLSKILCNVDPRDISPRHGTGASACGTRPWERYSGLLFDPELNAIWPYLEFCTAGRDHTDQILSADFISNGYPKRAKGVFVPKDYRGPRFISCEPATSMYHQQGLMTLLVEHLQSYHMTKGFVNFTNQRINQELAREGSEDRKTSTLDLKDASDLLSWDLIVLLWPVHWVRALRAVRSRVTEVSTPKGKLRIPLRKHAPMGSAVCFPVMALTIWCLIRAASISVGRTKTWIYGDDIIVASKDAAVVCDILEAVSLRVNRDKSFLGQSPFRESCGKEYWNGSNVTPIYCRYDPTDNDTDIASLCAFNNNMVVHRGPSACSHLTSLIQSLTKAPITGVSSDEYDQFSRCSDAIEFPFLRDVFAPTTEPKRKLEYRDPGPKAGPHLLLGADWLCNRKNMTRRWNKNLQRFEFRIRRACPVHVKVEPVNWGYVLRSSLIGGDLGFSESAALAKRSSYKYGWVSLDW